MNLTVSTHLALIAVKLAMILGSILIMRTNSFARAIGGMWASAFGRLDGYTQEHRAFLSSAYVCQNCNQSLIGHWLKPQVKLYDSKGEIIPLMQARLRAEYCECPACLHRWQPGKKVWDTVSTNTQLARFLSVTATHGNYPLETPLEIGRVNGTSVILTVGKPTNQKLL